MAWRCFHCNTINDQRAPACASCGADAPAETDRQSPGEEPAIEHTLVPVTDGDSSVPMIGAGALVPESTSRATMMGSSLGPPIPWVAPEIEAGLPAPEVEISPRGVARKAAIEASLLGLSLMTLLVLAAPLATSGLPQLLLFMVLTALAAGIPLVTLARHWRTLLHDVDPVIYGSGGWLAPLHLDGQRQLVERGCAVRGEIVGRRPLASLGHWQVYLITYRFLDGNRVFRTGRFRVLGAQAAGLEIGHPITVIYDPDQPTRNAPYGALGFRLAGRALSGGR